MAYLSMAALQLELCVEDNLSIIEKEIDLVKKRFPWIPLVSAPTPLERLENLSSHVGKDIWIKRDDKTSPIYGGNKPRKLEFILAEASAAGRKELVTGGGLGSNHVLQYCYRWSCCRC